jgi:DNA modification methylase
MEFATYEEFIESKRRVHKHTGRSDGDEKHICPLQLDTIERSIHLWSNEEDTILTPFAGIGSEIFQAIKMKRKGIGFELKKSYFEEGVKNLLNAEKLSNVENLF